MARDPYDHGQEELPCFVCHGRRAVVEPVAVTNPKTGEVTIVQEARSCGACGGTGKVWV